MSVWSVCVYIKIAHNYIVAIRGVHNMAGQMGKECSRQRWIFEYRGDDDVEFSDKMWHQNYRLTSSVDVEHP